MTFAAAPRHRALALPARPRRTRVLAPWLLAMALAACKAGLPAASADVSSAPAGQAGAQHEAKTMDNAQHTVPAIAPPSPGDVLEAIYDERGDGSDSYRVANGSVASFWYGYEFDFGGKRYYTGFAYSTPEKYGKDAEADSQADYPAPDAQVTLSQATFERSGDAAQPWTLFGAQPALGEFGGYERGPAVDASRRSRSYATAAGADLLAVPARESLNEGIAARYYELFLRAPNAEEPQRLGPWRYVGSVDAGGDNAEGCAIDPADAGRLPPCVSRHGEIAFEAVAGEDLPQIAMTMSGTEISGPDQVRKLDGDAPARYRYDAKDQAYRPAAAH